MFQGLGRDHSELQQARHERARAREGLDDSHARVSQALAKCRVHRIVCAADDEVDDLDGREDDAQALAHAREGLREEAIVERAHDLLLARQGMYRLDALDHRLIEGVEFPALVLEHRVRRQHLHNRVHRTAHRVLLRERMIREHRVKQRGGENVLGQHLHSRLVIHRRIQGLAQRIHELLERILALRILQQAVNQVNVTIGDRRNVLRPVLPVQGRAHLLHDPTEHRLLPIRGKQRELALDALGHPVRARPRGPGPGLVPIGCSAVERIVTLLVLC